MGEQEDVVEMLGARGVKRVEKTLRVFSTGAPDGHQKGNRGEQGRGTTQNPRRCWVFLSLFPFVPLILLNQENKE